MADLFCPHLPRCPGCPRFGSPSLPPALFELQDWARAREAPPVEVVEGVAIGYRHRVRLSARKGAAGVELGIFERGSHRLVAIPRCVIHHPSIVEAHTLLEGLLSKSDVVPYDEPRHRGLLRAVQMAVQRSDGRVQVVFVLRDDLGSQSGAPRILAPVIEEVMRHVGLVHSVWLNAQPERTNTLLGDRFVHVAGPETLEDISGGARVFYPPAAFGQANPVLHDQAVQRIHHSVPPGARVVEFHAGVGTIGLGLCRTNRVVFNEVGAGSLAGLRRGIEALPASASLPRVAAGPADDHVDLIAAADVVIVDPPRKGLSHRLLDTLCMQAMAPRLIYLSCGLTSFLSDAQRLIDSGWRVRELTALGYFPYTDHVETLARFEPPSLAAP